MGAVDDGALSFLCFLQVRESPSSSASEAESAPESESESEDEDESEELSSSSSLLGIVYYAPAKSLEPPRAAAAMSSAAGDRAISVEFVQIERRRTERCFEILRHETLHVAGEASLVPLRPVLPKRSLVPPKGNTVACER